MENNYIPKNGETLLATFSDYPEGVGTIYLCTKVTDKSFCVTQTKCVNTGLVTFIPKADRKTFKIPFEHISIINLYRKEFNFGRV
jgi:hypothetical protein